MPFPELDAERNAATVRCKGSVSSSATRITFFRDMPASGSWDDIVENQILGYAVVAKLSLPDGTERTYVLEAVIRPPAVWLSGTTPDPVTNYYVHCCRDFQTTIGTATKSRDFRFVGTFFCQQNSLTHVCAHAALRTAVNSSPQRPPYKLTNEDINTALGIDHTTSIVGKYSGDPNPGQPAQGLDHQQIITVAKKLGFEVHFGDFTTSPAVPYAGYIYPLIESGFPTILAIEGPLGGHAIAVLGHTLNSDRWTPDARVGYGVPPIAPYIPTSAWADHLIVADDNFGMYITLPSEALKDYSASPSASAPLAPSTPPSGNPPPPDPNLYALLAIGLVPKGIGLPGYIAEQIAAYIARAHIANPAVPPSRWIDLMRRGEYPLICRTLLFGKADYIATMSNVHDDQNAKLSASDVALLGSLPDRFWVTELTLSPLLSGNKRKLGDVLLRVDPFQTKNHAEYTIFVWLPGAGFMGPSSTAGMWQGPHPWSIKGHIPVLRGSGQSRPRLEW